jgi:hypothetical protein
MQDQNRVCAFENISLIFQRMPRWQTNTLCVTVDIDSAGWLHRICSRSGMLVASDEEVCIKVAW